MLRKKICLLLCIVMITGVLFACQSSEKENPEDFLAGIEIGMTQEEGWAILGEPLFSFTSGPFSDTYLISDTHIAVVWYNRQKYGEPWCCTKKEILTYDEFSEKYGQHILEALFREYDKK